jgi:hypothetical protein
MNGTASLPGDVAPVNFPAVTLPIASGTHEYTEGAADAPALRAGASAALPCLFVTTACKEKKKEENRPLPGPRKKQADALTENVKWLAATFGKERMGFLTLTLGDKDARGRFRNLRDRKEAQRRFHSLLTNVIAKRYQCGVTITERHDNMGIPPDSPVATGGRVTGGSGVEHFKRSAWGTCCGWSFRPSRAPGKGGAAGTEAKAQRKHHGKGRARGGVDGKLFQF